MKRSEINDIMREGVEFLQSMRFLLPPYAFWAPDAWREKGPECREIVANQLGWDITDFGSGDFAHIGLLLFTIRNGNLDELRKPNGKVYAEKVLIVRDGQVTPTHFHHQKMEDIINRGGGELVFRFWNASADDRLAESDVTIRVDGVERTVPAGSTMTLQPGESACLPQRLYHTFWAQPATGTVLVGEVSRVNDDTVDNHFYDAAGRFPDIVEDVPPLYLLSGDYHRYYQAV